MKLDPAAMRWNNENTRLIFWGTRKANKGERVVKLDPVDLVSYLMDDHGFSRGETATAVAVVKSESNFVTDARGRANPEDRGLWQLNRTAHPGVSDSDADNWVRATDYAVKLYRDGEPDNWGPWKAYTRGLWKAHHQLGWMAVRVHVQETRYRRIDDQLTVMRINLSELLSDLNGQLQEVVDAADLMMDALADDE